MAVSFDHPLGQTSDGTGGKCSSLLSCPEKWEIVSTYIYIHPYEESKSSNQIELSSPIRLLNETYLLLIPSSNREIHLDE